MSRPHPFRRLPVLALLAALSLTPRAQVLTPRNQILDQDRAANLSPTPASDQSPGQSPSQNAAPVAPQSSTPASPSAPPDAAQPAPTTIVPTRQPTPEELGDSLSGHQRYQAAIAAYSSVSNPSATVWNKMGIAYQMMFNLKDASRCYRESLRLDTRNPQVYNNLGTVYDSDKDFRNGEKMYRKALKFAPHDALILKNLGTNLLSQHKYNKGWEVYQQALAIDPSIFQDHSSPRTQNPAAVGDRGAMNYFMARGCVRTGQTDCAIEYLRLALNEGYTTVKKLSQDGDFLSLHGNPAFQQLLAEEQQQSKPQQQPGPQQRNP